MRKTKIICTLGPSTDKDGVLRELVANGMNVARFNFSHGSYEEHKGRLDMLKAIRTELGKPVAALLDTKGPEIRLKEFKNGVEMLEAGQTFTLTTRICPRTCSPAAPSCWTTASSSWPSRASPTPTSSARC